MKSHELPKLPANSSLPRPIVLRPEDLAHVAIAGAAGATLSAGKIIVAGGIPAGGPSLA